MEATTIPQKAFNHNEYDCFNSAFAGFHSITSADEPGREIVVFPGSPGTPSYPAYIVSYTTGLCNDPYRTLIPVKFDRQCHSCNFYAGFGPTVYDFLRARTNTTASIPHLQALEETVTTTSQPAQATRCKGLREERAHPRRQLVIAVTITLHKTN